MSSSVVFLLYIFFRVTLPCAPQLLICAETNGGNAKTKTCYSISCVLPEIYFNLKLNTTEIEIVIKYLRLTMLAYPFCGLIISTCITEPHKTSYLTVSVFHPLLVRVFCQDGGLLTLSSVLQMCYEHRFGSGAIRSDPNLSVGSGKNHSRSGQVRL
jgi:hypothetical protein